MAQGNRHPKTNDFLTKEEADRLEMENLFSLNLERFHRFLTAGTLGNTGPKTLGGATGFGSGRWEQYFNANPSQAKIVGWKPNDTAISYMSRNKNRNIETDKKREDDIESNRERARAESLDAIRETNLDNEFSDFENELEEERRNSPWYGYLDRGELVLSDGSTKPQEFVAEGGDERYEKVPFEESPLYAEGGEDLSINEDKGYEVAVRGDDNSFETKEQEQARLDKLAQIKKEIYADRLKEAKEENRKKYYNRWQKKYESIKSEHIDKDLEDDIESNRDRARAESLDARRNKLEEDKLNTEFSDFEGELKKEKELEKEKTSKRFDNKEGMLNPLVVEEHTAFLGEIESAGFKGVEAVKLAKKLASLCGSRQ